MSPDKENESSESIKRKLEEYAIFNNFYTLFRSKFLSIPFEELLTSSEYQGERRKLRETNEVVRNGMAKGLLVGVSSFIFLRSGPRIINRYLRNKKYPSGGGYQFDNVRSQSKQIITEPDPNIRRPGILLRTIKFSLDVLLSMSFGMFGTSYFLNWRKIMNELVDIPLVEGRSALSDETCNDFIDLYKSIPKRTWDKFDGESESLDAIGQYVRNCLRRREIEKKLLAERNEFGSFDISSEDHIAIPSPGVPADIDVEIPWVDKSKVLESENDNHFDDGSDEVQIDFEWNDNSEQPDENGKDWK